MPKSTCCTVAICFALPGMLLEGCTNPDKVTITSEPNGASVYLGFTGLLGIVQVDILERGVLGQTPCDLPAELGILSCRVVWPDGVESEVKNQLSEFGDLAFHFVKPESFSESLNPPSRLPTPPYCSLAALPRSRMRPSLAVFDFHVSGERSAGAGAALADLCRVTVQDSDRFTPIDREDIASLLSEEDLTSTMRCDSTRCLINYGKKVRAQTIIHGRINQVGATMTLTIKLLDVGTGEIAAIKMVRIQGSIDQLLDFVEPTTCELLHDALSTWR